MGDFKSIHAIVLGIMMAMMVGLWMLPHGALLMHGFHLEGLVVLEEHNSGSDTMLWVRLYPLYSLTSGWRIFVIQCAHRYGEVETSGLLLKYSRMKEYRITTMCFCWFIRKYYHFVREVDMIRATIKTSLP